MTSHPERLDASHRRLLWLLAVACFSEGYDFALLTVALPQVRHTFHLTHTKADLWIALLYLGALPALVWGRRADRNGRRGVLLIAIVGYTLAAAVTAAAPSIGFYVACQFVARCFIATQVAIAWTMAAEDLPAERRGVGFGILALSSAMGTGFCAIVQAVVISPLDASWRWLYVLALPFLVVVVFLRRALPESARYLAVERSDHEPQPGRLLTQPPFVRPLVLICLTILLINLTTEATIFSIDFLENRRHLSTSSANLLLVAAGALALPVLTLAGRLSDRIGRRRVCMAGLVVQAGGLLLFFIVARGAFALGATLVLVYIGLFAAWTTGSAIAVELFPTSLRAAASSAAAIAKLLGQSASFALGAGLLAVTHRPDVTVAFLVIGPLAGVVLIATVVPETSRRELTDVVELKPVAADR
ncbi:MAG: transporter, putative metabolite:H+ symporter [Frankiaceae bacterium]|nr:transporter, putative metabolite:H+ symporter [Frankiaceae bacterium]